MGKSKLKQLIERYFCAAVERLWIGTRHPSEYGDIEREYQESRRVLMEYINAKM